LPHVLLLGDVLKALDLSSVYVDGPDEFLNPVAFDVLLELLQTFIPAKMNEAE
jgi:hypothetical protein